MMTAESMLLRSPVLRITVALYFFLKPFSPILYFEIVLVFQVYHKIFSNTLNIGRKLLMEGKSTKITEALR